MFGLFKKKSAVSVAAEINYGGLKTDMHSHLLPGIDDGSPDAATSVAYIKAMMKLGYEKFITTPHIYPDLYPNTRETILAAHGVLKQKLKEEQVDVEIIPAAEYFIDDLFADRLKNKEPLLTIHKNWVLVEISFMTPPPDLNNILFDLIVHGYQPVLAHPERYSFYHNQKEIFHRFKDQGCLLQINLLSLSGYYGRGAQEAAQYMLQEKIVDLMGTDLHHQRHLDAMHHPALFADVQKALQTNTILNSSL
ncbi:MAG: histidinol phosphatase [Chitinophagaceae bacterium]|jgi:protein-tyrosine phosphatase|nr:histidinol phosphatase [Chitinophagaceae bacterium]